MWLIQNFAIEQIRTHDVLIKYQQEVARIPQLQVEDRVETDKEPIHIKVRTDFEDSAPETQTRLLNLFKAVLENPSNQRESMNEFRTMLEEHSQAMDPQRHSQEKIA